VKLDIIKELQSDSGIYAQCPDTGESFQLKKAVMFYIDQPIPEKIQKILDAKRQDIKDRRKALRELRKKTKERVEKATMSINIGKMLEKVAPAVKGFEFDPRDCRSLLDPIDYIVFNQLTRKNGLIDSIFFIDVKTGKAGLTGRQRQIRDVVQAGKVVWDQYRGWL